MSGRCKERPELVDVSTPFEVWLPTLPVRGDADLLERLFEPLGYLVSWTPIPLDTTFSDWGPSRYCDVHLATTTHLRRRLCTAPDFGGGGPIRRTLPSTREASRWQL